MYTYIHSYIGDAHTYVYMYVYTYTYIHTYIGDAHTYIHIYIHTYIPIQVMQAEMEQWTIKVKNAEELRWLAGMNLAKAKVGLVWTPGGGWVSGKTQACQHYTLICVPLHKSARARERGRERERRKEREREREVIDEMQGRERERDRVSE
jgi:hypothetical protein